MIFTHSLAKRTFSNQSEISLHKEDRMKIATVGKGGSGKTTIAGTLSRVFAENGRKILAIDGDPNPNLALTLGMSREEADAITYIPASIMQRGDEVDGVIQMVPTIPREEIMSNYASAAAKDVDLIVMGQPAHGTAGSGCMCASHRAVRGLVAELTSFGEHTVTDMEAGLEHLKRGTARHVDMMLVVAEPYYRSLEAAMRTADLAKELGIPHIKVVANKVRNEDDMAAIQTFCDQHGMEIIGTVPLDDEMVAAERKAQSPYDFAPQSEGVTAIRRIAAEIDLLAA
ncbi:ATP-binding protein [Ovoidimarina sediminis]|uniref:ATP-binding protein n=1 Tax=Ovoidimarina sediminis TaxID=3079856 RepID=UPI00290D1B2A|nr:AAA family ATPase [Rhodophyticola sp. MJ-SS7]MDU8944314.1 AAA family ATPase [Rhodophyticola sp. MJ-SS7]